MKCPTCGHELIQKPRLRLAVTGLCLVASSGIAFKIHWFWTPAALLILAGIYLIVWATIGGGRWCRQCKQFVMAPKD